MVAEEAGGSRAHESVGMLRLCLPLEIVVVGTAGEGVLLLLLLSEVVVC